MSISSPPKGTAVGVNPGSGGTMLVQHRMISGGVLRDWAAGTVAAKADDVLDAPMYELVVTATGVAGDVEWSYIDTDGAI